MVALKPTARPRRVHSGRGRGDEADAAMAERTADESTVVSIRIRHGVLQYVFLWAGKVMYVSPKFWKPA
jgi:hypothetical protein